MLPAAMARSSFDGDAIRYVLPVLWMMSCFHIMVGIARIKDDANVSFIRQMAAPVGRQTRLRRYVWLRSPVAVL